VFSRRRQDIVSVHHTADVRDEIVELARWARSHQVPCEQMTVAELDRTAQSTHHEGLRVIAKARPWLPTHDLADLLIRDRAMAIALDRVRNPYNVGAILRNAAFFGVRAVVIGASAPHPELSPLAIRVAEGGVEFIQCCRTTDLADTLTRLRSRGVHVTGTDGQTGRNVRGFPFERPTVLVVGHEREGLSARVRAACEAVVGVRGSGTMESLNVAVATGVLLAEMADDRGVRLK